MTNFYQGRTVVVTGATGFVGSHFLEQLLVLGAKIKGIRHLREPVVDDPSIEWVTADLTSQAECDRALTGASCVIHAAGAVSAAGVTSSSNPMSPITENLVLTARVLQGAWTAGAERFLVFSSSTGYPPAEHPVKEEEFWSADTYPGYFGYGWMRRYLERMAEFAYERSGMKVSIIRPTAVYGPRDDFDPVTSHVIPALIRRAVQKEDPYVVWGGPDVVRDFLHISDLVRGCLMALEHCADADPINIGYGDSITIGEIVSSILQATGHLVEPHFDESKPTTIPFRMADITKAKEKLGFSPSISFQEGLRDTVEWYCSTLSK
jgi:GDP-L-fucose synthase